MRTKILAAALAIVPLSLGLSACETGSTLQRADQPQVLTGAQLPTLVGFAPNTIVAFAMVHVDGVGTWRQIPVQVDERKVVGFGTHPGNNSTPGVSGTVYGNGTAAVTALQYTDPNTWVGADSNVNFDADDELVFMSADAGGPKEAGDPAAPAGVVAGSGVRVDLTDPLSPGGLGTVYLFRSSGGLVPAAGKDYVTYQFNLTSGNYKTTYLRSSGPNPETSFVTTPNYRIDYTDRWMETAWEITAGAASQVDILDAAKNQFDLSTCGRSNLTFADAEGAFVANIDGPVRGIRSYVGANSGPKTQRTHLMYRNAEHVVTDLRVHSIPQIMDFIDLSPAASGMTYRSETVPGGVTVDGVLDSVPTSIPDWEAITGNQGSIIMTSLYQSSINPPGGFDSKINWFYRDQLAPPEEQCFGDSSMYGTAGPTITGGIATTDPIDTPHDTLKGTRIVQFAVPMTDGPTIAALGTAVSNQLRTPLTVTVGPA